MATTTTIAGLPVTVYCGPERDDGKSRLRVQLGDHHSFDMEELALLTAYLAGIVQREGEREMVEHTVDAILEVSFREGPWSREDARREIRAILVRELPFSVAPSKAEKA